MDYAIYKGDKFLFLGTKKECADYLGVNEKTIMFYQTPTYLKRREKSKENNYLIVIKIEDDEKEENYDRNKQENKNRII